MSVRWLLLAVALAGAAACDEDEEAGTETALSAAQTPSATGSPTSAGTAGVGTPATPATPTPAPAATSAPTPTDSGGTTVTPSAAQPAVVEAAIDDLASRLGVPRASISVVSHEETEWNDGSLGCPQPGMSYTQALVPGYRIVLRHAGTDYAYHGRTGGAPFYCANPG